MPLAALAVIGGLDIVSASRHWPVAVIGALDEPAHLLTAGIALMAFPGRLGRRTVAWVLCGSVVIDLDHLPLYLGSDVLTPHGGRPVTHSLATVAVLLALCAAPRVRPVAGGLALGVLLHLARDIATGPGVPLLWPLSAGSTTVPYVAYLAAVGLAAVYAALVLGRRRRTISAPRAGR